MGRKRGKRKRKEKPASSPVPEQTVPDAAWRRWLLPGVIALVGVAVCAVILKDLPYFHSSPPTTESNHAATAPAPKKESGGLSARDRQALRAINAQIDGIAQRIRLAEPLSPKPPMQQIKEMIDGPEEKVDLTLAEFLLASEIPEFKGMDIIREIARVEWLAGYVRYLAQQYTPQFQTNPQAFGGSKQEFFIRMMVLALNSRDLLQIAYVDGKPNPTDPRQFFVNGLMDTRRGVHFHARCLRAVGGAPRLADPRRHGQGSPVLPVG